MASRTCPLCLSRVSAGIAAAFSDSVECPNCKAQLQVSTGSRMLATTVGFLAAALVWRFTRGASGELGFVLPTLYAFLVYSGVSALVLMFVADLRTLPAGAAAEPAPPPPNHRSVH